MLAGALWAGIAGLPQGDGRRPRGDHDDHAQLDRVLDRQLRCSASAARSRTTSNESVPISNDIVAGRDTAASAGATRCSRACTSASSSRSARSSSTGSSSTARRSATRCAPSATTRRPRATAASASRRNYFLAMAISGAFAGLGGGARHPRLAVPARRARRPELADRLHRHRRRAARPQHARSGSSSRRSSSARSSTEPRRAASTPRSSRRSSPGT